MPKEETKEKNVSMYDPVIDAYREIPVSRAKLLIEEAKRLEKVLASEENE